MLDELKHFIEKELQGELLLQGHKASGNLLNSINITTKQERSYIVIEALGLRYGKDVDLGRKPFAKRIPVSVLEQWIRLKKFQRRNGQSDRNLAFAIQNSIYQKGISTPQSWKGVETANWIAKATEKPYFIDKIIKDIINYGQDILSAKLNNLVRDTQIKLNAK